MSKLNILFKGKKKKNILAVFAHPDDEAYLCGGILQYLASQKNIYIKLLTFSHSNVPWNGKFENSDYENSINLLGVKDYKKFNLIVSGFHKNENKILKILQTEAKAFKPDIVLTYDPSGITGNSDHMILFKQLILLFNSSLLLKRTKLMMRLTSNREMNYFKTKYILSFDEKNLINYNLSYNTMYKKIKAIFSYKKSKGLLAKLHIIDWFLSETQENYLLVDKVGNLKYKIIYN